MLVGSFARALFLVHSEVGTNKHQACLFCLIKSIAVAESAVAAPASTRTPLTRRPAQTLSTLPHYVVVVADSLVLGCLSTNSMYDYAGSSCVGRRSFRSITALRAYCPRGQHLSSLLLLLVVVLLPSLLLLFQCMESQYINSRPFRVNAGAVHAYVQAPNDKTAYLSELKSGSEVLVVDAAGRARTAVVGRCKIETRPMVIIKIFLFLLLLLFCFFYYLAYSLLVIASSHVHLFSIWLGRLLR